MKKNQVKHCVLLSIFLFSILFGCKPSNKKNTHQKIQNHTDQIFNSLVEVRRDFHKYPELAGNEIRTSKIITNYLLNLGLEVKTVVGGYGVIGILKGEKQGKSIAWRADMDALPHDFSDDVEFKSKVKGIQHGCGHDVHMAIGLGIAEVLSKYKSSISGTICFIFQPEEETFQGAKNMIENGLFETIDPDEIYGLHVCALPVGKIMVKPKEVFAYQKGIQISMKNEISKLEARALYEEIKNKMTRIHPESEPWNLQNAFDPKIGLSNPNTIFNDYCFMDENAVIETEGGQLHIRAYLYETSSSRIDSIIAKIEGEIKAGKHKNLFHSVAIIQDNPTVMNNEVLTNESIKAISKIYGIDLISSFYGQIPYFNDDFCYFQQKIPGVYFLLGGSNHDKGIIAMNHAPNFRVDEECIRLGVKTFSSFILERTNKE